LLLQIPEPERGPPVLRTIIKKELLENLLTYRFPLFFVICAALVPTSLYVNSLDYAKRLSEHNEQTRLANDALGASRMWEIHMGTIPIKGFRRPAPLSIFATGFESSLPRYYEFLADGYKAGETSVADESILSVSGRFDFVFIIQMVVSLMVLLLASDLVAGEKELGTLRGVLSNSVPRHIILIGKLLGGFFAVWLPFAIAFLIGCIVLSITPFPLSDGQIALRVVVIFLAASLFILSYFTLGLMVSASASRTRTTLVAILLVWIFFQLVIPKVSDMVASVLYPIRTETVVSMQKSLIVKSLDEEKAKLLGKQYETIFGKGAAFTNDLPQGPGLNEWTSSKNNTDREYRDRKAEQLRQVEDGYRREKRAQLSIAGSLSLVSPSAAFTRFLTDLCGTGEIDKEKYQAAVKAHQQTLDAELYSHVNKTTLILPGGGSGSSSSIDKFVDLKTLPEFSMTRASFSEVLAGNAGSLISIAFWLVAPFAVAYVKFLRYDVR
jgi:ABC-type transport system involved in multi-copper enzyme maturation permease subunit